MQEGKIMGFSKKTIYAALAIIVVAGVMFYAGAKYEKNKLSSLGVKKSSVNGSATPKTKKSKTPGAANTPDNTNTAPDNTTPQGVAPTQPGTPTTPSNTDTTGAPADSLN